MTDAARLAGANTVLEALQLCGPEAPLLAAAIAAEAAAEARKALGGAPVEVSVLVSDRAGAALAEIGLG